MGERPPASIVVDRLSHRYPGADVLALRDVSFTLKPGLRLGLLGPNGAGKSTMMRILCGYLPLQGSGAARVGDFDVRTQSLAVRERVGYMPEQVPLYPELRVREHLGFRASIKRIPRRARPPEIARVAEATGITDRLSQPIGQLSRGYRQRVGIADALLGQPPLLVLDEPTVGLDPNQVQDIRAMLRALGGTQTLVFSSHILAEVEALCDHVVILSHGRVAADESLAEAMSATHVDASFAADHDAIASVVAAAWKRLGVPDGPPPTVVTDDGQPTPRRPAPAVGKEAGARGPAPADGEEAAGRIVSVRVELPSEHRGRADDLLAALGAEAVRADVSPVRLAPGETRLEARFAEVTGARPVEETRR